MNTTYAQFYGPEGAADGCAACQYEISKIGREHGPQRPPRAGYERWSMTPREWAGDGPLNY